MKKRTKKENKQSEQLKEETEEQKNDSDIRIIFIHYILMAIDCTLFIIEKNFIRYCKCISVGLKAPCPVSQLFFLPPPYRD